MHKIAVALVAFATITSAGCAAMGTKRPSGGAQIQKTTSDAKDGVVIQNDAMFEGRADLGQR